jgi:hypothetical protein
MILRYLDTVSSALTFFRLRELDELSFQFNTSLFLGFRSFLKTHALGFHFLILVLQLLIFDIHLVNLGLPLCCFMLGLLSATQIKVKTLRTCILAPS